jgi:NAD(P)-dependent dehydrogenase (short-subunit alcohol dehydrogenase family)
MEAQGSGAIVNVTSYVAEEPSALYPTSSAMRAGLPRLVQDPVGRGGPKGIRVNSVMPGFIDSIPQPAERFAQASLRRQGRVEEAAKVIAFLCGEGASYVTGAGDPRGRRARAVGVTGRAEGLRPRGRRRPAGPAGRGARRGRGPS